MVMRLTGASGGAILAIALGMLAVLLFVTAHGLNGGDLGESPDEVLAQVTFDLRLDLASLEDGGDWSPLILGATVYPPETEVEDFHAPYAPSSAFGDVVVVVYAIAEDGGEGEDRLVGGRYFDHMNDTNPSIVLRTPAISLTASRNILRFEVTIEGVRGSRFWTAEGELSLGRVDPNGANPIFVKQLNWQELVSGVLHPTRHD
jgi:hypothetical protein